jgi:phosphotransferase system  glucose/maltose/N-acetylglucosamine-specific IIC component
VFYLCGLCGLAVSVAVLRVAERRRVVMALALAAAVLAVVGGLVQLP